jgi:hypothetical protein
MVDSVDVRILSETVGIFEMRQEADMHRLLATYMRDSGKNVEESIAHITGRWKLYQATAPVLQWSYGSSYKFFMSGNWDNPEAWPYRKDMPSVPASQPETDDKRAYEMWSGMNESYKASNPWRGAIPK